MTEERNYTGDTIAFVLIAYFWTLAALTILGSAVAWLVER